MSKRPYSVVLLAILVVLAGCGSAAHSTSRASATPTATPSPTASPCDFKVSTTTPTFTGQPPQAIHPIGTFTLFNTTKSTAGGDFYYGLAMVSDDEGWAVGGRRVYQRQSTGTFSSKLLESKALILHYSTGKWTPVNAPTSETLLAVTMVSRTEGWAVGTEGVILHYHGGNWTVAAAPRSLPYLSDQAGNDLARLTSISIVSSTEGWAAGSGGDLASGPSSSIFPILVHYHGGKWEEVEPYSLTNGQYGFFDLHLNSVSMTSATDGLAAGSKELLRYHQGTWTVDPNAPSLGWTSVFALSPTEGWAFGLNSRSSLEVGHYCGGQWHMQTAGITLLLDSNVPTLAMQMVSPTEGWASAGLIMFHYTSGQWIRVGMSLDVDPVFFPSAIRSISMVSATTGWALVQCGKRDSSGDYTTVMLHYQNGSWNAY